MAALPQWNLAPAPAAVDNKPWRVIWPYHPILNTWSKGRTIGFLASQVSFWLLDGLYNRGTPAGREPDIEDIHHVDGSQPITETPALLQNGQTCYNPDANSGPH